MSNFQLPIQSGTGPPFDQVTKQPTKVSFRGIDPGSDAAQDLMSKYGGAIRQFQSQQAQNFDRGIVPYSRTRAPLGPGITVTYTNDHGNESIEIEVTTEGSEEKQPPPPTEPWQTALIDFTFPNIKIDVFLAAFVKPQTAEQKAMTDATRMPVRGVSAIDWDNTDKPILEFGDWTVTDAPVIREDTGATDMVRSLRVDLLRFPNMVVEVEIYGYTYGGFSVTGGPQVDEDGNVGQLLSSTRWGSLTYDYRPFNSTAWAPGSLSGASKKFFWESGVGTTDDEKTLLKTFPELTGFAFVPSVSGDGDPSIGGQFKTGVFSGPWTNDNLASFWFDSLFDAPTSVTPSTDPNAWPWLPIAVPPPGTSDPVGYLTTTLYWDSGTYPKMKSVDNSYMFYSDPTPTNGYVSSVSPTAPAGALVTFNNVFQTQYYVPTWFFTPSAKFTLTGVCAHLGNPWKAISHKTIAVGDSEMDTYQFEVPSTFPNRPKMSNLGSGKVDVGTSDGGPDGNDFNRPSKHFAAPLLGTVKIDTRTGGITWKPV